MQQSDALSKNRIDIVPSNDKKFESKVMNLNRLQYHSEDSQQQLGAGAFGVVRKATIDGRGVAVKTLKLDDVTDKLQAMELFVSEAKKMSGISHPRIVEFLGFVMETFSIVMEFMSEGTLAEFLKRNHMERIAIPWTTRYWFAADIAEGMAYLHSKTDINGHRKIEIFHQDLKPANVLLNLENGVLRGKISDLGLAEMKTSVADTFKRASKHELTSFVAHQGGTYAYMAPELVKGSTKVRQ